MSRLVHKFERKLCEDISNLLNGREVVLKRKLGDQGSRIEEEQKLLTLKRSRSLPKSELRFVSQTFSAGVLLLLCSRNTNFALHVDEIIAPPRLGLMCKKLNKMMILSESRGRRRSPGAICRSAAVISDQWRRCPCIFGCLWRSDAKPYREVRAISRNHGDGAFSMRRYGATPKSFDTVEL